MPRPRLAARAVLAALTAVAGCRTAPHADEGGTLRLAVAADVTGFFPDMSNETYSQDVNGSIFEGLSGFDAQLRVRPLLAARWQNPDQRTYIFDIRPGVRFSDGRPLTADDVVASLEAHLARRWVYADYLQAVESVRAVGPQRVEIRTRFPYLLLLYKLPYGLVVPKEAVADRASRAIGTGPYRLESWRRGQDFVLARNEHYWGQRARFARAHFVVEPDAARRVRLLEAGATDVVDGVPLERIKELERRNDIRVNAGPGNRVLFLGLRLSTAPFSDPRVREAIELALDRAELIERALYGRGTPARQLVPPAVVGFDPKLAGIRTDRAKARQLLASAGLAGGLDLRLDGPNNRYANDSRILVEVARQLSEVGLRVQVNAEDKIRFFDRLMARDSSFFLLGWACESGDSGDALDTLVHSPNRTLGRENYLDISDPRLDGLIDHANSALDRQERAQWLRQATARLAALHAIVPLTIQTEAVATSRRVQWTPPLDYALRLESFRPAGTAGQQP